MESRALPRVDPPRAPRLTADLLRRPGAAAPAPRAGVAALLGRRHHRCPGLRDARLRPLRRDEHRPAADRALQVSDGAPALARRLRTTRGRGRGRCRRSPALPAAVPHRDVDLGLPAGRRQPRPPARQLGRRDRHDHRRHRRRPRDRSHLLLHLARRYQRPEGRRGGEAGGGARRHLPGDGRRSRLPDDGPLGTLARHGRGRGPARRGAADRLPAVAPAQGAGRHAQPPQDRRHRQPHHLLRVQQLR